MIEIIEDTGCVAVYTSFGNIQNARKVIDSVMEGRLAACANSFTGVVSDYWWEGKLQHENEIVVIFKTSEHKMAELMNKIKELHEYSTPCLIAYKITAGETGYIDWLRGVI
jgi:periplasmic divalent cation tolerance protein